MMVDSHSQAEKKRFNVVAAAFLLLLAVAAAVGVYEFGEIDAQDYRAVKGVFKEGTPYFRVAVAKAMKDGKINRWEYRALTQTALDERRPLIISTDYASLAEERLILFAMAKQVPQ